MGTSRYVLTPLALTLIVVEGTDLVFAVDSIPACPGEDELRAECRWIRDELGPDVPVHFTAFHPEFKMLDVAATPHATLLRARGIAAEEGLLHAYTGNVHDVDADTTSCPGCGAKLAPDAVNCKACHSAHKGD